ncbi:hypothetical protein EUGRSUZ_B02602 [Eucalyptus grandis]|uniref:Uncharacterized protein n=2 Tax=Eucalyptus grandis TaxID=71139 RepID=A0ACC3LVC1_EUCGR|nr:hypothetical protein EUGRSUZ_B02602 [Eucalyptus grandis]
MIAGVTVLNQSQDSSFRDCFLIVIPFFEPAEDSSFWDRFLTVIPFTPPVEILLHQLLFKEGKEEETNSNFNHASVVSIKHRENQTKYSQRWMEQGGGGSLPGH